MGPSRARHRLHHPHPEVVPIDVEPMVRFLSRRRIGKPAQTFDRAQPVHRIRIGRITSELSRGPIAHQVPQMADVGKRFYAPAACLKEQLEELSPLRKGQLTDLKEILESPHPLSRLSR